MKIIFGQDQLVRLTKQVVSLVDRRLLILVCTLAIGLSGCVKYDTGINFTSLNYGEIVEQIQLGEQLNSFSQNAVKQWVSSIEQRVRQADGQIERISDQELRIVIPFNNMQQLVAKIDQYFNPSSVDRSGSLPHNADAPLNFNAHMQIEQNNFVVVVRNHLIYDVDLRSLAVKSRDPKVAIAATDIVDLNFKIQSPWGVQSQNDTGSIAGENNPTSHQINWHLNPGEINHLEAIFWLPNSLGIGAILIALISGGGYYLKYRNQ